MIGLSARLLITNLAASFYCVCVNHYQVSGKSWQDYTVSEQTAGYITKWAGTKLAFATVHGAGHEVPTYKPDIALSLWKSYLAGELTNA